MKTAIQSTGSMTEKVMKEPKNPKSKLSFKKRFVRDYLGYIYVIPVLLGIVIFTLYPMGLSMYYSLHDYKFYVVENQVTNFGFQHYISIFTNNWPGVSHSLWITARFAVLTVSVRLIGSYCLALFLNQQLKGIRVYRVLYYLPCLIPAVASTLLWKDITSPDYGFINMMLRDLGLPAYTFYNAKETVLPTILITGITGWGGNMIMWLSQMQNVPTELYESADLDGANYFQKVFKITIPMTMSVLFYLLMTGIIGALQVFEGYYPLRNGICDSEIDFIVMNIYDAAWVSNNYSYACALSWFLFVIIGVVTILVFKLNKHIYYAEEA